MSSIKSIITSQYTKDGVKKLLSEVDDLVLKKKTSKNPSELLQKADDVTVGDKKIKVGTSEETVISKKDFKVKEPKVAKETIEEFLESFKSNTVSKKILADFNIDKINSNEDIIKMINLIAKTVKPSEVVKQTRGVRTQGTTKSVGTKLSKDENFLVNVLGTKAGSTYNAEQIYGIRQLYEAGLNRLNHLAKKAADTDYATDVDVIKFRQHYALMAQIHKVLLGVRTETARALNQFKIPSNASKKYSFLGGDVDSLNRQSLLVELGGKDEVQGLAKLYLSAPDDVVKKINAVEKTGLQKISDATAEIFLNAILSNPLTHVRNSAGNWIAQAIVMQERKMAAKMLGGQGSGMNFISPYEDVAKTWGKFMAAKEIMAAMQNVYKLGGSKVETKLGQVTAQNFGIKNEGAAAIVDVLGKGLTLGNYPTKWLKVADDYFKNREFRSEVYALAFSEGMEMYGKRLLPKDKLATYIASRVANPTKEILSKAYSQAQYTSFQTQLGKRGDVFDIGAVAQKGKNFAANRGPFSWITNYYLPFVQTPTNIAGFVAERTPVLAQILTNYNAKIAAGGREAAIAKAQLRLGSYVYLIGSMLGYYGVTRGSDVRLSTNKLTGGENLLAKTTKTQPFQIEIPIGEGKYQKISFQSFDPISQMFANAASSGQMLALTGQSFYGNVWQSEDKLAGSQQFAKDALLYAVGLSYTIGQNISNSTMLAGAGKFVDDVNKLTQGGLRGPSNFKQAGKEVLSEMATSYIPTGFKQIGKIYNSLEGDNFQKIATEFEEYTKRNFADNDLEYDYDLRGRKYDKFMYFSQFERDAIDEELYRVNPKITPPRDYFRYTYGGVLGEEVSVKLNSQEKRWFRQNIGKIFDAKLNEVINSRYYQDSNTRFERAGLLENAWEESKNQARDWFEDPNKAFFETTNEDGQKYNKSYISALKERADELKTIKINAGESGEQRFGGFIPDGSTPNLIGADE